MAYSHMIAPVAQWLTPKRVALFDLDGTLINSLSVWPQVDLALWQSMTEAPAPDFAQEHLAHFASKPQGNPWVAWCARLASLAGCSTPATELHQRRFLISRQMLAKDVTVMQGVQRLLETLIQANVRLGLVTNTRGLNLELYQTQNPQTAQLPWDRFEVMVNADWGLTPKPDPAPYLAALEAMKIAPEEVIVFEDAAEGVIAAHQAGLESIGILHATHPWEHAEMLKTCLWCTPSWELLFEPGT